MSQFATFGLCDSACKLDLCSFEITSACKYELVFPLPAMPVPVDHAYAGNTSALNVIQILEIDNVVKMFSLLDMKKHKLRQKEHVKLQDLSSILYLACHS